MTNFSYGELRSHLADSVNGHGLTEEHMNLFPELARICVEFPHLFDPDSQTDPDADMTTTFGQMLDFHAFAHGPESLYQKAHQHEETT